MITTAFYDRIKPGDWVRSEGWPTFHEVKYVERRGDMVMIDIAVGGLLEALAPAHCNAKIEVDGSLE